MISLKLKFSVLVVVNYTCHVVHECAMQAYMGNLDKATILPSYDKIYDLYSRN